jgi:hypothetical protein
MSSLSMEPPPHPGRLPLGGGITRIALRSSVTRSDPLRSSSCAPGVEGSAAYLRGVGEIELHRSADLKERRQARSIFLCRRSGESRLGKEGRKEWSHGQNPTPELGEEEEDRGRRPGWCGCGCGGADRCCSPALCKRRPSPVSKTVIYTRLGTAVAAALIRLRVYQPVASSRGASLIPGAHKVRLCILVSSPTRIPVRLCILVCANTVCLPTSMLLLLASPV